VLTPEIEATRSHIPAERRNACTPKPSLGLQPSGIPDQKVAVAQPE
jgi:hypothetical protein